jgi:hypothetical protein
MHKEWWLGNYWGSVHWEHEQEEGSIIMRKWVVADWLRIISSAGFCY